MGMEYFRILSNLSAHFRPKQDKQKRPHYVEPYLFMVPGAGIEPARPLSRGIFLPATAFAAIPTGYLCGLDFLFTLSQSMHSLT